MHTQSILRHLAAPLLVLLASAAVAGNETTSHDGLQLTPSKNVEVLYTRPGASLAGYKRVALLDCQVAFRKNWQRDQNSVGLRVSAADMDRIKNELAKEFRTVFTEELGKGGYEVVAEGGEDVLVLRPAIVDLDVQAPDIQTAGRSRSFSTSAGSMTLFIELFDGATGEIVARAADRARARDSGRMMWQNSVTNRNEALKILRKWAKLARSGLDNARAAGAAAPTP